MSRVCENVIEENDKPHGDGSSDRALAGPSADACGRVPSDAVVLANSTCDRLVASTTRRLERIYRQQIRREPWPVFADFRREDYPLDLRREAARHWARRSVAEYGSIHQFSGVTHALCEARVGLELLGPLTRLMTDEVRHAEICARMAVTCDPSGPEASPQAFAWEVPQAPWPQAPDASDRDEVLTWAASAILVACCLGETISRPMYDALLVVCTDEIASQVLRQIQRDEHLHAAFGWDALAMLWPALTDTGRQKVQERLRRAFGGFESTTACGYTISDVAGREVTIARAGPNLGVLEPEQYAMIFFATVEQELFPALDKIGLDPADAWARRPLYPPQ